MALIDDPRTANDMGPLRGKITRPKMQEMWVLIWRAHERGLDEVVPKRDLAAMFEHYGGHGNSADVYLCEIRKLLKSNDVPFKLETVWGVGVRLRAVS